MYFDTYYYVYIGVACLVFIVALVVAIHYRRRRQMTTVIVKEPQTMYAASTVQIPHTVHYAQPPPIVHYSAPVQTYTTVVNPVPIVV